MGYFNHFPCWLLHWFSFKFWWKKHFLCAIDKLLLHIRFYRMDFNTHYSNWNYWFDILTNDHNDKKWCPSTKDKHVKLFNIFPFFLVSLLLLFQFFWNVSCVKFQCKFILQIIISWFGSLHRDSVSRSVFTKQAQWFICDNRSCLWKQK